jgi:4-amino-4-deoxy-L-arabinose transferase-like glycosyltransferase
MSDTVARGRGLFTKPVVACLAASLAARIVLAAVVPAGNDEAYYYVYSLNPALSYFDHPPVVALLAGFAPALTGVASAFTIRLGALVLFVGTSALFYKLARELTDERSALAALIAFSCCPLILLGAGAAILPDAGMAFFWVASLLFIKQIVLDEPRPRDWLAAGALSGLAMLSKYHGVLLPGFLGLYLLIYRRDLLRTPWPYVFVLGAAAVFSPVIVWNITQDFASFRFQGARAGGGGVSIVRFLEALGGQAVYLTPMYLVPAAWVGWRALERGLRGGDAKQRFYAFFGAAPVLVFLAIAFSKRILPHWTLAGFLLLMVPLGELFARLWATARGWRVALTASAAAIAVLLGALAAHGRWGLLQAVVPVRTDATVDAVGWDELVRHLEERRLSPKDVFLFTHRWELGGQITLATGGAYDVMCFSADPRGYSVFDASRDQRGKDGLFVGTGRFSRRKLAALLDEFRPYFDSVGEVEQIEVTRGGVCVDVIYVCPCRGLRRRYPTSPHTEGRR